MIGSNMTAEKRIIYYLSDYNWEGGELVKENRTTYKIRMSYVDGNRNGAICYYDKNISKEKCAFPDELVCVVWETWKGVNGRGGYRVERVMYPADRLPAKDVAVQHDTYRLGPTGRVNE
jgi:hypothetical protein